MESIRPIYLLPEETRRKIQQANIGAILATGRGVIRRMLADNKIISQPMPADFRIINFPDRFQIRATNNSQFSSAAISILGENSDKMPYGIGFRRIRYDLNDGIIEFTG
ncbi:MAG: hypothetical protein QHH09_04180 [Microgenomates group bacterium]|nr:hypothetical protein [Microgenomates group bacterium]